MISRTLRLLAALLAAVLVLGACGDDGDDEATPTTEAEVEDTAVEDDEGEDETDGDESDEPSDGDEAEEPADPDGDDAGTDDPGTREEFDPARLAEIDDFCELIAYGESVEDPMFAAGPDDPDGDDAVQQSYAMLEAMFVRGAELAPSDIEAEFSLMSTAMVEMLDVLETYDYDFEAMDEAAAADPEVAERIAGFESPELSEASTRIDEWVDANC